MMLQIFRNNPEKLLQFGIGIGPEKFQFGIKKQFAGGGIAGMLG